MLLEVVREFDKNSDEAVADSPGLKITSARAHDRKLRGETAEIHQVVDLCNGYLVAPQWTGDQLGGGQRQERNSSCAGLRSPT